MKKVSQHLKKQEMQKKQQKNKNKYNNFYS